MSRSEAEGECRETEVVRPSRGAVGECSTFPLRHIAYGGGTPAGLRFGQPVRSRGSFRAPDAFKVCHTDQPLARLLRRHTHAAGLRCDKWGRTGPFTSFSSRSGFFLPPADSPSL